jgi:hypothetical protein
MAWQFGTLLLQDVHDAASKIMFTDKSKSLINMPEQQYLDSLVLSTSCTKIRKELRKEERVHVSLPVNLGDTKCLTYDVSAMGVFIVSESPLKVVDQIEFIILIDSLIGKLKIKCNGEIVRAEQCAEKVGVAVKITKYVLETA